MSDWGHVRLTPNLILTHHPAVPLFYMHLGSFLSVIVSFKLCERPGYSPAGVTGALSTALIIAVGYLTLAWRAGEWKHFDVNLNRGKTAQCR